MTEKPAGFFRRGTFELVRLALVLCCFPAFGHSDSSLAGKVPVIVDTDAGLDDLAAIAALAGSPTVDIVGVTTVGGASGAARGADNAARWLAALGLPEVPVAVGADPVFPAPPWRPIAEAMAGLTLPPPGRPVESDAAGLFRRLLARHPEKEVVFLALGPLTNLARWSEADPAASRNLAAVYLLGAEGEKPWNLAADPESAGKVLEGEFNLRFLPGEAARGLGFDPAQRRLLAESPQSSARWLEGIWKKSAHPEPPLMDAALAAAFLDGELPRAGAPSNFRLDAEGVLREGTGNNSVSLEFDAGLASRILVALWHGAPEDQPEALRDGPGALFRLVALHGHLGPYVVLGYRAGLLARHRTGSSGYFDLTVQAVTRGRPPESCFIDGLQLGSGATPGKGNLVLVKEDAPPRALVTARSGRTANLRLRQDFAKRIAGEIARRGVGPFGLRCFAWPAEALFEPS